MRAARFSAAKREVVILENKDSTVGDEFYYAAIEFFSLNKAVLRLGADRVLAENLPPALAETIPNLPAPKETKTVAVVCSGFACKPPVSSVEELRNMLE